MGRLLDLLLGLVVVVIACAKEKADASDDYDCHAQEPYRCAYSCNAAGFHESGYTDGTLSEDVDDMDDFCASVLQPYFDMRPASDNCRAGNWACGYDQMDLDGDGYTGDQDCDDGDADTYPGAREVCDGEDNDCDGALADDEVDADGDGSSACEGDCDDGDPTVNLGAREQWYDGVDSDCDGESDYDADGDGYNVTGAAKDCDDDDPGINPGATDAWYDGIDTDCDGADDYDRDADGWTSSDHGGLDCADDDPDVNPGQTEVACDDGIDNDCDGLTHDAATDSDGDGYVSDRCMYGDDCDDTDAGIHPGAEEAVASDGDQDCDGLETCYVDADEDGFRGPGTVSSTDGDCDDPGEAGDTELDCDDSDPEALPTGIERCDGIDNDCDGIVDDGSDDDGDGYYTGSLCAAAGLEDCDDSDGSVSPGATEVCGDGKDQDCGGAACTTDLSDSAGILLGSGSGDSVETIWGGDLDGDGLGDLLVGAIRAKIDGIDGGAVYVVFGPSTGTTTFDTAGAVLAGEDNGDYAGSAVWGGDLDGDGQGDVIVGAVGEDTGGFGAGSIYFVAGPLSGSIDLEAADGILVGESTYDSAGDSVWGADLDGDGRGDALVGAGGAGVVYLVSGPLTASVDLSKADVELSGSAPSSLWTGDVDGDGVADALVGDYAASSSAGAVYVLHGPLARGTTLKASADATLAGEDASDYAGWSTWGGDFDGDGLYDALVGAYGEDAGGSGAGAAYVVLSPMSGSIDLSTATCKITGDSSSDYAGIEVSAGDVDGDGQDDALVGATMDDTGGTSAGAVYVALGPLTGTISVSDTDAVLLGDSGTSSGGALATSDLDADGRTEPLVGGSSGVTGPTLPAVFLVFGGGI